ncbi:uncharacterized protein [Rutidosis leptorrhynchoides]|uniref:uncharacterized protein n=1 Tax=Rutidosis leptorrhynchoides TaxID=125765 RepID=UPI003A999AB6
MVDAKKDVLANLGQQTSVKVKEVVNDFQTNCKNLTKCFSKQSEAAITTIDAVTSTVLMETCLGGLTGLFTEFLYKDTLKTLNITPPSTQQLAHWGEFRPLVQSFFSRNKLKHVRNLGVMSGVSAAIICLSKEIRGKDNDVETSILSGFGVGVALSLVTGIRGPTVISCGVIFALVNAAFDKLEKESKRQPTEMIVNNDVINSVIGCAGTIFRETAQGGNMGLFTELIYNKTLKLLSLTPPSSMQLARFGEYRPLVQSFLAGPSLEHVRNLAVISGVNATITCLSKEIRGKVDLQTCFVAGFSSGVAISLVTGMRDPAATTFGVICGLVNAGMYHVKMREINQSQFQLESNPYPN